MNTILSKQSNQTINIQTGIFSMPRLSEIHSNMKPSRTQSKLKIAAAAAADDFCMQSVTAKSSNRSAQTESYLMLPKRNLCSRHLCSRNLFSSASLCNSELCVTHQGCRFGAKTRHIERNPCKKTASVIRHANRHFLDATIVRDTR